MHADDAFHRRLPRQFIWRVIEPVGDCMQRTVFTDEYREQHFPQPTAPSNPVSLDFTVDGRPSVRPSVRPSIQQVTMRNVPCTHACAVPNRVSVYVHGERPCVRPFSRLRLRRRTQYVRAPS
jgi:hypothetical protein